MAIAAKTLLIERFVLAFGMFVILNPVCLVFGLQIQKAHLCVGCSR